MKFHVFAALSAIGCLFASAPAPAGYQFVLTGITSGEVIPINTTRTVNLFLNYDGTGAPNELPGGLFAAWAGLRYTTNASASLVVANPPPDGVNPIPAGTGIRPNTDFAASTATRSATGFSDVPNFTKLHALLAQTNPPTYATSGSANNVGGSPTSLFIGSFDLRTNNTALANVPLTLQANLYDTGSIGSNILTDTFAPLDAITTPGTISFTVAGVPEPGTMALVGFAATGFAGTVWRKRRAAKQVKSEE